MKTLLMIMLVALPFTIHANDEVERIYQILINSQHLPPEMVLAAKDTEVANKDYLVMVSEACWRLEIAHKWDAETSKKFCGDAEFRKQLASRLAQVRLRSKQASMHKSAEKIAEFNKLVSSCKSGTERLFESEYSEPCEQKVKCKGDVAKKLKELGQDFFNLQLGFNDQRVLTEDEKDLMGVDLSPAIQKLGYDKTGGISHFSGVTSANFNVVNKKLEQRLEELMEKIGKKIEKNPKGLSALTAYMEDDGIDSLEEMKEWIKSRKSIASGEEASDPEAEAYDPAELKALMDNLKDNISIAEGQISQAEAKLVKFYRKNQKYLENPVRRTSEKLMVQGTTWPDGIMLLRGLYCSEDKVVVGTKVKKHDELECEVFVSNHGVQKFEKKSMFTGLSGKQQLYKVENKCLRSSPFSFLSKLFKGKKASRSPAVDDGERESSAGEAKDSPAVESAPSASGAQQ